jgi:hypothetical protein
MGVLQTSILRDYDFVQDGLRQSQVHPCPNVHQQRGQVTT